MLPDRLRFALEQLRPNQWERFEEFASAYLVVDYPSLRTVAGNGDRGRDAELIQVPDDPQVRIQYSVEADWKGKVTRTAKQIAVEFPGTQQLVYATNQKIGPAGDDVKAKIRRNQNLFVDFCDSRYSVERCELDPGRAAAADGLVNDIAMPILADRQLVERNAPALSSAENRAACVHLALEYSDAVREKGLTKLCFEALVKSVLRDTDPGHRLSREEIHQHVSSLVGGDGSRERSDILTDAAIGRLERHAITRWAKDDEFCLTRTERERVQQQLEAVQLSESELLEAIAWQTARTYEAFGLLVPSTILDQAQCVRAAVETVLFRQGEIFAAAVTTGSVVRAREPDIEAAVRDAMISAPIQPDDGRGTTARIFEATTHIVLTEPAEPVQEFFRSFADAYTLFAFLRQTPDVQSAIVKLYSIGEIWLDSTVSLPLLAETLLPDASRRRFTNMFAAARECGLSLHVTPGVVEEIEAHTWRCIQYSRQYAGWRTREPFLAKTFVLSGQDVRELPGWLERFRGNVRPEEDVAQYLDEVHGIKVRSLEGEADAMPAEMRGIVQEVWHESHERRQDKIDVAARARLVAHDVENYLGVVGRRRDEGHSAYGHRSWWLTLDHAAYSVPGQLRERYGRDAPDSPVITPDFMVAYLAVGPLRAKLKKESEARLPLSVADLGPGEAVPRELIEAAENLRQEMHGKDDRIVRRQVRDSLDLLRRRRGTYAQGGLEQIQEELQAELVALDERSVGEDALDPAGLPPIL